MIILTVACMYVYAAACVGGLWGGAQGGLWSRRDVLCSGHHHSCVAWGVGGRWLVFVMLGQPLESCYTQHCLCTCIAFSKWLVVKVLRLEGLR